MTRAPALTPEDRANAARRHLAERDRCIGNAEAYEGEVGRLHMPLWQVMAADAAAWWRGKAGENSAAAVALMPSLAAPCACCGSAALQWCHEACPTPRKVDT